MTLNLLVFAVKIFNEKNKQTINNLELLLAETNKKITNGINLILNNLIDKNIYSKTITSHLTKFVNILTSIQNTPYINIFKVVIRQTVDYFSLIKKEDFDDINFPQNFTIFIESRCDILNVLNNTIKKIIERKYKSICLVCFKNKRELICHNEHVAICKDCNNKTDTCPICNLPKEPVLDYVNNSESIEISNSNDNDNNDNKNNESIKKTLDDPLVEKNLLTLNGTDILSNFAAKIASEINTHKNKINYNENQNDELASDSEVSDINDDDHPILEKNNDDNINPIINDAINSVAKLINICDKTIILPNDNLLDDMHNLLISFSKQQFQGDKLIDVEIQCCILDSFINEIPEYNFCSPNRIKEIFESLERKYRRLKKLIEP